jgi:hypothetical protein
MKGCGKWDDAWILRDVDFPYFFAVFFVLFRVYFLPKRPFDGDRIKK